MCTSKDKGQSRNTSRLDEKKVYNDKSSDEGENHTFSLSSKQSSKNKPFKKIKAQGTLQGDVRVCGDAALPHFWGGFAEIFALAYGIAVFQGQVVYQFDKFRCHICGILLFFRAVLSFLGPPPLTSHSIMADSGAFIDVLNEED